MSDFVGRRGYIATLEAKLDRVQQTGCDRKPWDIVQSVAAKVRARTRPSLQRWRPSRCKASRAG
jgi:hypothetical protein